MNPSGGMEDAVGGVEKSFSLASFPNLGHLISHLERGRTAKWKIASLNARSLFKSRFHSEPEKGFWRHRRRRLDARPRKGLWIIHSERRYPIRKRRTSFLQVFFEISTWRLEERAPGRVKQVLLVKLNFHYATLTIIFQTENPKTWLFSIKYICELS